tara:strand:+ start:1290 stop:1520 length:231 start_codon:yes stop_codon:yes gene_type:complete
MSAATLTLPVAIMFAVALTAAAVGMYLLSRLRAPIGEARVYAYRMVAVMALALAAVLAMSAAAMWSWNGEIASGSP